MAHRTAVRVPAAGAHSPVTHYTRGPGTAAERAYSGSVTPEPPISFGKSFSFGKPSRMLSTFSP